VGGDSREAASEVAGAGIGLAAVTELVSAYGGGVAIEDAPGGGARFIAELPAAPERP
jgi:two-component system OmpR family sensor kinase